MRQLVYLPQASIFVAETQRIGRGWGGPRPPAVGPRRRLRRDDRPPGRRPDARRRIGSPRRSSRSCLRSASNKGCTVVEAVRPDDPAARARLEAAGLRRGRAATTTNRDRGGSRRASHLMTAPAEQRDRAGGAHRIDQGVNVGKNVAVFVDVANIFYAAKAAGVDIDYVTLLKSASAGRDLVRAYAYTGLDPDNENQRNFHDFLRRQQLQGRQQGHPQVRRRQGQGQPRHRARRRHDEDRPEPRHRDRRVGRRRLRARPSAPSRRRASASRSSASAATPART